MISMNKIQKLGNAKSILFRAAGIVLITLFMAEIALRLSNHYIQSYVFYSDSYNRFRGRPFADELDFKLNSLGFKDEEFAQRDPRIYRILGIGDSFAFGIVPYKYNYLSLIESQLQADGLDVEILNMGIPSIGPHGYLSLLIDEGLELQPDMVLVSFFIGNDFEQSKKKKAYEYSYVASLLHTMVNLHTNYEGQVVHGNSAYCDTCPSLDIDSYLAMEHSRSSIYLIDDAKFPVDLENALYYLDHIHTLCKNNDMEMMVVIIPDEMQVNRELMEDVMDTYYPDLGLDEWDISLPNRKLHSALDALGIDNLDLYDAYSTSSDRLYLPRNSHWNIAGNQLAADTIQERIRKYVAQ
ncbi:MAG: hypothetical protein CME06_04005 [Gemmatimonadetes bacterium]|nr:hypothetical protein [Gemmatimonadota bacterium]